MKIPLMFFNLPKQEPSKSRALSTLQAQTGPWLFLPVRVLPFGVDRRVGGAPQNAEETRQGLQVPPRREGGRGMPLRWASRWGHRCLRGAELLAPAWRPQPGQGTEGVLSRPALLRAESTVASCGDDRRGHPWPP